MNNDIETTDDKDEVSEMVLEIYRELQPLFQQAQAADLVRLAAEHDLTRAEQGFLEATYDSEAEVYTVTADSPPDESDREMILEVDRSDALTLIKPTVPVGDPDAPFSGHSLESMKREFEDGRDSPLYGDTPNPRQRGMQQAYSFAAKRVEREIERAQRRYEKDG